MTVDATRAHTVRSSTLAGRVVALVRLACGGTAPVRVRAWAEEVARVWRLYLAAVRAV